MVTVLFVHGTGVREEDYTTSLNEVNEELQKAIKKNSLNLSIPITKCYWGEIGAKLKFNGKSIPGYSSPSGDEPTDEEIALWQALYQNPFYELRSFANSFPVMLQQDEGDFLSPSTPNYGDKLHNKIETLTLSSDYKDELAKINLTEENFAQARNIVIETVSYKAIRTALNQTNPTVEQKEIQDGRLTLAALVVARAIFTTWIKHPNANEEWLDWPRLVGQTLRESILSDWVSWLDIINDKPGETRDISFSIGSTLKKLSYDVVGNAAAKLIHYTPQVLQKEALLAATNVARTKRSSIMNYAYRFMGDIVLYQGRHGQRIRDFIFEEIKKAPKPVVILAHSLGGIMAVDVLVEHDFKGHVAKLITVGTQVPLLYEIDGLISLECRNDLPEKDRLPSFFPSWLNIFDQNHDLLSFQANPIFGSAVEDCPVNNSEPFMASHSAYWRKPKVLAKVIEVVQQVDKVHRKENGLE